MPILMSRRITRTSGDMGSSFVSCVASCFAGCLLNRANSPLRCCGCSSGSSPTGDNRRFIIATCEKGTVESIDDMKEIKARLDEIMKANPNFVEKASVKAFRTTDASKVSSRSDRMKG